MKVIWVGCVRNIGLEHIGHDVRARGWHVSRAHVESASLRLLETNAVLELPNPIDAFDHPTSLQTAIVYGPLLRKRPPRQGGCPHGLQALEASMGLPSVTHDEHRHHRPTKITMEESLLLMSEEGGRDFTLLGRQRS